MSAPGMKGVLDGPATSSRRTSPRVIAAVFAALVIGIAFYFAVHYVHTHIKVNPLLVVLYPPLTVAFLVVALPFIMFASFINDFQDNVNPLNASHYVYIFKKTYSAMLSNNMKVSSKEL